MNPFKPVKKTVYEIMSILLRIFLIPFDNQTIEAFLAALSSHTMYPDWAVETFRKEVEKMEENTK